MQDIKRRRKKAILFTLIVILIAIILTLTAKYVISFPCVFYKLTGLYCPGCGNTRAAIALLSFDFPKAFSYNAFFFFEFFYIVWVYIFSVINYIKNKRFSYHSPSKLFDCLMLAAFFIWGIVRNFI
ncbi:MAG: DUF2752 domain-containing protein [Ruminococcaceae bacterium]|nr:DUF2752 domain-containing protein [Oscillospiraceae bacterium]